MPVTNNPPTVQINISHLEDRHKAQAKLLQQALDFGTKAFEQLPALKGDPIKVKTILYLAGTAHEFTRAIFVLVMSGSPEAGMTLFRSLYEASLMLDFILIDDAHLLSYLAHEYDERIRVADKALAFLDSHKEDSDYADHEAFFGGKELLEERKKQWLEESSKLNAKKLLDWYAMADKLSKHHGDPKVSRNFLMLYMWLSQLSHVRAMSLSQPLETVAPNETEQFVIGPRSKNLDVLMSFVTAHYLAIWGSISKELGLGLESKLDEFEKKFNELQPE